jgi:GH15 family glucan-1,4-alpha-glucosidase
VPAPLEDYGLLGDLHSAALVGRDGSIDWLCVPRFDSGSCFGALLGTSEHGRWRIAPVEPTRPARRAYRGDTLVLETEMETTGGVVAVIDAMPPRTEHPTVVRVVEGREGAVPMRMDLAIRFDYGSLVPWVRRVEGGLVAVGGSNALALSTPAPLRGEGLHTVADFTVRAGERVPFTLAWFPSHHSRPEPLDAEAAIERTLRWWGAWSGRCAYEGEWRDPVMRSLVTLKALTYAPTGGLVAAPTTSLPERLGGVRNWDYRFCWLRDATFALYALTIGGYVDEARDWRQWLIRAVAGAPAQAQILYGLAGERLMPEWELSWLPGYEGSRPVRVGNAASAQFQLDVYGEVMDAFHCGERVGLPADEEAWRVQRALVEFVVGAWERPDEGIWEVRAPRRHFTHSKVMAWVALDRGIAALTRAGVEEPLARWRAVRDAIHADVCRRGFDAGLGAFVQYYGSRAADASLLMIPLVGFLPATDPRVVGTVELVRRQLEFDGLVARYRTEADVDGLPPGEGLFLACTFWLADNLALQGRQPEARRIFERLLSLRNDLGLLAEQYDPVARRLLGNFPQAISHVGLINTARNLAGPGGPAEHRAGAGELAHRR